MGMWGLICICLSSQLGKQKKKYMPYNHQHKYFFLSECPHPGRGDSPGRGPEGTRGGNDSPRDDRILGTGWRKSSTPKGYSAPGGSLPSQRSRVNSQVNV